MIDIIIIGNTKAAEIIYGYLLSDARYNVVAFSVDAEFISENTKFGLPVVDFQFLEEKYDPKHYQIALGVGYKKINQIRALFYEKSKEKGYSILTYIHPSAVVNNTAKIGEGSMILSNSVIEPYAILEENILIWSNCTIAHHSKVESHVWIASNSVISGSAIIKQYTFVGVNVTISNEVVVHEKNIIGARCLITKNTNENEVYLERNAEKHRFDAENYSKYYLK